MANQNFTIHNGLTVGPLTIDAANGNITTTGTIISTGTVPASFAANVYFLGNIFFSTDGAQIFGNDTDGPTDPAYTWIADRTTGMFNPSTGVVGFSSQGVESLRVDNSGNVWIRKNTSSTNTTTGALVVTGGVGIAGALNVGSTLAPGSNASVDLGSTSNYWNNGYVTNQFVANVIAPTANTTASIGTATATFQNIYGVNFFGTSTTAKYADLAENYLADNHYAPGTVLDFGGDQEVTISTADASTRVAGVVSTNPAYLMNSNMIENMEMATVALTGRVPTKVQGIIRKGDQMVSAGNGRARAEANPVMGSVIGKALENFDGDTGVIEVVVGRL